MFDLDEIMKRAQEAAERASQQLSESMEKSGCTAGGNSPSPTCSAASCGSSFAETPTRRATWAIWRTPPPTC